MDFFNKTAHKSLSRKNGYAKNDPAGVGIVFKSGPDEALFVKALADGGPAANCGMIRVNDCLIKVDGEDVYRMPIEKVVEYILGEKGSEIRLTFQRFSGDKLSKLTVKLMRGNPASIKAAVPWAEDEAEDGEEVDEMEQMERDLEQSTSQAVVLPPQATAKSITLEEKQRAQQERVSERLSRMKEMQNIIAMSYTGSSRVEDESGVYEGDINHGVKNGRGVMKFRNGDIYTGYWKGNMMEGDGTMVYSNGEKFHGEWVKDRRNGKGSHIFRDMTRYEGQFFNDDMHGLGTFYYRNGSVYQGEWKENRRHGVGVLAGAAGTSYHGLWKMDKKHGSGVVHYKSGLHEKLIGRWINDDMEGWSTMINRNGDRLEGIFVENQLEVKHGQGTMHHADGSLYEGEWFRNEKNGFGTYTYKNGDQYVGTFRGDMVDGEGLYTFKKKDTFNGQWSRGKMHGRGVYTYANDTNYIGHWHQGRRHGEGHYTLKNGNKYFETRDNGVLIGERRMLQAQ